MISQEKTIAICQVEGTVLPRQCMGTNISGRYRSGWAERDLAPTMQSSLKQR